MKQNSLFILDSERLVELAASYRESYALAEPFRHIVMDDFLPAETLREVADNFPSLRDSGWHEFDNPREKKLAFEQETQIEDKARWLLYQLNSSTFVRFLELLTGIDGLIPDPYFVGGGLHQIEPGGFLKIHADFNRHSKLKLDRRLNLLVYLNENWQEEWGGALELWSRDMSKCARRILPLFNRAVVFETTDFSFHGHPDPLACPIGRTRKSLALYYYTNGRPGEELSGEHGTLMRSRPGEEIHSPEEIASRSKLRSVIKRFIPPILLDAGKLIVKK